MLVDMLLLLLGLALLGGGGDVLVRGATGLARRLGVTPLVVGLTVVAFGTSSPELFVNLLAVWRGSAEISFGNIMGSNMANIGLIIGCTALLRPLPIRREVVGREIPMMLLATVAALVMAYDVLLRRDGGDVYDRSDGVVLLLFFVVFLYYTTAELRRQRASNHGLAARVGYSLDGSRPPRSAVRYGAVVVLGLLVLVVGARLTVDGAIGLARGFGVSEVVIALTLVAVGTSLPELAASVVAALRGQGDLAVGNVVGSNIFNLLLVAGVTATLRPIDVPWRGHLDLLVVALLSLLLLLMALTHTRRIIRIEAAVLLVLYAGYLLGRSFWLGGG